jgi:hypothetical protein
MEYKDYLLLAIFGIASSVWKVLTEDIVEVKKMASKAILSLLLSVGIIPAVMDYYHLSITIGIGLTVFMTIFSDSLIELVNKKIKNYKK